MALPDYYSLLGLTEAASPDQIKAAFRKCAKDLHPDLHPGDAAKEEQFKALVKAYEVLSDPQAKEQYDFKRKWNKQVARSSSGKKSVVKKDSISPEEAERRKYYQKHYAHASSGSKQKVQEKSTYNETKLILICIPLAVLVLFGTLQFFKTKSEDVLLVEKGVSQPPAPDASSSYVVENGATPYRFWFGNEIMPVSEDSILVYNHFPVDIIFVLYTADGFYHSHGYLQSGYALYHFFPKGEACGVRISGGQQFDFELKTKHDSIIGLFKGGVFYLEDYFPKDRDRKQLHLMPDKGFSTITEQGFFERTFPVIPN